MKIYDAAIVEFTDSNKSDFGYTFEILSENYNKKKCVKNNEYMIDINTKEKYYILQRNNKGIIDEKELPRISLNVPYVYSYSEDLENNMLDKLKALKVKLGTKKVQKTLKR